MKSMRSISSASEHINKLDESFFQDYEMLAFQKPYYGQLNLKIATDSKIPSPWSTIQPHIIASHRPNRRNLISPQKTLKKELSFRANNDAIKRKPVENNQEAYKMNNTLVEFRVKATLNREGLKSRRIERSPQKLQISELNLRKKQISCISKTSDKHNSSRQYSIGQDNIQKTPRIQFLQRKLRIKQFSGKSPSKKKPVTTVKPGFLDVLGSSERATSFRQRGKIKIFNTINIRGSSQVMQNRNSIQLDTQYF